MNPLTAIRSKFKSSDLVRDTTHLSIGQGLKLGIQAAYFALIARSLGPSLYGAFVAITALTGILSPFSGMGSSNLFIKNARSGKRAAALCWGNGLVLTCISGVLFCALVLGASHFLQFKVGILVIATICVCDLVFNKITELASFGFAASLQMKQTSIQNVVSSLLRLLGIASLMVIFHHVTLQQWTVTYLITGVIGAMYALYKGYQLWGTPRVNLSALREDAVEGVYFSISTSATTVYNDIDKTMLGKLSDLVSTGIYGAAYRLIDVSMTPVRSLTSAAYPRFFALGTGGVRATYPYAKKQIRRSAIYGLVLFISLWLAAPLAVYILGEKYRLVVPALRWLSIIPFLRCIHAFLADALSGANYQRTRTTIQVAIAFANVGLNLIIIPRYSWRGAAWTSVGCDSLLVVCFWLAIRYALRQEAQDEQKVIPATLQEFSR